MSFRYDRAEIVNQILKGHKLTKGRSVAMGATCQCGYWTGNERAGITRPVGVIDPLDWHRAELIAEQVQQMINTIMEGA